MFIRRVRCSCTVHATRRVSGVCAPGASRAGRGHPGGAAARPIRRSDERALGGWRCRRSGGSGGHCCRRGVRRGHRCSRRRRCSRSSRNRRVLQRVGQHQACDANPGSTAAPGKSTSLARRRPTCPSRRLAADAVCPLGFWLLTLHVPRSLFADC